MIRKEDAKVIDLDQWVQTGGGNQGDSFVRKDDDMTILKLYSKYINPDMIIKEIEIADLVQKVGIVSPGAGDLVRYEDRYGIIFKRILNKKSFCRVVADEPERVKEMAQRMATMAKDLHSRSAEGLTFESVVTVYSKLMERIPMEPEVKAVGYKFLEQIREEDQKTIVHGDFHFGNLITDGKTDYFIDLGQIGYGNPDVDNSMFFIISTGMPEEVEMRDYHITTKQSAEFWKEYKYAYYGPSAPSDEAFFERFRPYLFMRSLLVERDCGKNPLNDGFRRKFAGLNPKTR